MARPDKEIDQLDKELSTPAYPRWMPRGPWRMAGLVAVGAAPFLLFLMLLPPKPSDGIVPAASASPQPVQSVPLVFPFESHRPKAPAAALTHATPAAPSPDAKRPSPAPSPQPSPSVRPMFGAPPPACSNGVDDDGQDGIDMADPGCSSPSDPSEADNPQCSNGLDDDGDGAIDSADSNCTSPRGTEVGITPPSGSNGPPADPGMPDGKDPGFLTDLPS